MEYYEPIPKEVHSPLKGNWKTFLILKNIQNSETVSTKESVYIKHPLRPESSKIQSQGYQLSKTFSVPGFFLLPQSPLSLFGFLPWKALAYDFCDEETSCKPSRQGPSWVSGCQSTSTNSHANELPWISSPAQSSDDCSLSYHLTTTTEIPKQDVHSQTLPKFLTYEIMSKIKLFLIINIWVIFNTQIVTKIRKLWSFELTRRYLLPTNVGVGLICFGQRKHLKFHRLWNSGLHSGACLLVLLSLWWEKHPLVVLL